MEEELIDNIQKVSGEAENRIKESRYNKLNSLTMKKIFFTCVLAAIAAIACSKNSWPTSTSDDVCHSSQVSKYPATKYPAAKYPAAKYPAS